MKKENWVWMPHPGHLCVARDCQFHLNTYVGGYIVSTVGEYLPHSARKKDEWEYQDIGMNRKYETMVFRARKATEDEGRDCCPYTVVNWTNIDFEGYNSSGDARAGHIRMCKKWATKK